jgi:hypothetical protein
MPAAVRASGALGNPPPSVTSTLLRRSSGFVHHPAIGVHHPQENLQLLGLLALVMAGAARNAGTMRYRCGELTAAERARRELTAPVKTRLNGCSTGPAPNNGFLAMTRLSLTPRSMKVFMQQT